MMYGDLQKTKNCLWAMWYRVTGKIKLSLTEDTHYTDCFGIALNSACCSILQVKFVLFNYNQQDTIKIKDIDVLVLNKYKKSSTKIESRHACLSMHKCVLHCVSN